MPAGKLPDFLVIGVQKSGTTALHYNLRRHPEIEVVPNFVDYSRGYTNRKETEFFTCVEKPIIATVEQYRSLFNDNGRMQGEVSPNYFSARALDKIQQVSPHSKLIIICRDPVARLESSFNHLMQWRDEHGGEGFQGWFRWSPNQTFEENLHGEMVAPPRWLKLSTSHEGLVHMGFYDEIIDKVLARFSREQLLILVAEEYKRNPAETYQKIFDFLGLEQAPIAHTDQHVREKTFMLSPEQRATLKEIYRPHNERFFALIGREIPEWMAG